MQGSHLCLHTAGLALHPQDTMLRALARLAGMSEVEDLLRPGTSRQPWLELVQQFPLKRFRACQAGQLPSQRKVAMAAGLDASITPIPGGEPAVVTI
jgi:hypothetical protein